MGKKKISIADNFYDRCCFSYTLKAKDPGKYADFKLGGYKGRISSYRIEGTGSVALIRLGKFLKKVEAAVFTPMEKDAPLLMMDHVHTLSGDTLSVNVIRNQLSPLYYRQFLTASESFGKLSSSGAVRLAEEKKVQGSVSKKGSTEELAAMAEEYLEAYLRVVEFSEKCGLREKAEKTEEFSSGLLKEKTETAEMLLKDLGEEETKSLFDRLVFPLK